MELNELSTYDIAADIRLLIDSENVEDVTFSAALDGRDRVIVTVGVEGESDTRRFELRVRELA